MTPHQTRNLTSGLANIDHIRHRFFTNQGGVSHGIYASLNMGIGSKDIPDHVQRNRQICANAFGRDSKDLKTLYQIHSNICINVADIREPIQADAMVSTQAGTILGILSADCAPVLFADRKHPIIGAAHAGWKGAKAGVCEATIDAMIKLGANRSDIVAMIGPCIAKAAYAIGEEFYEQFCAQNPPYQKYFHQQIEEHGNNPIKWHFDLPGFLQDRLSHIASIQWIGEDTYSQPDRYFSYRRMTHQGEHDYGRQLSAIMIQP